MTSRLWNGHNPCSRIGWRCLTQVIWMYILMYGRYFTNGFVHIIKPYVCILCRHHTLHLIRYVIHWYKIKIFKSSYTLMNATFNFLYITQWSFLFQLAIDAYKVNNMVYRFSINKSRIVIKIIWAHFIYIEQLIILSSDIYEMGSLVRLKIYAVHTPPNVNQFDFKKQIQIKTLIITLILWGIFAWKFDSVEQIKCNVLNVR